MKDARKDRSERIECANVDDFEVHFKKYMEEETGQTHRCSLRTFGDLIGIRVAGEHSEAYRVIELDRWRARFLQMCNSDPAARQVDE
eukprot:SAG31_NODE_21387_length_551_cov_0.699115_1_plen_86_part_10